MSNEKLVRTALERYILGWKNDDRSGWLSLFSDDAELIDPVGSEANCGKDAIGAFWDRVHSMPMKFEPEVQRLVACGNEGMLLFTMITRPQQGAGGMKMEIVDTFKVNDEGFITQMKAYWDKSCMGMLN